MKKRWILAACAIVIYACSSKIIAPNQTDVDRMQMVYPNLTLAQLQKGKADYEKYCSTCHSLYKPTDFSEAKWKHEVPDMARKMKRKQGITLDEATQNDILTYLLTMRLAKR